MIEVNQSTLDYIRQHADEDVRQLALRGHKCPDVDLQYALEQIAGRQKARTKLPSWAASYRWNRLSASSLDGAVFQ